MTYSDLAHAEAGWLLAQAGVPYLVIKGPTTRDLLGQPERPAGDVDLLVQRSTRDRALRALESRGWRDSSAGLSDQEGVTHSVTLQPPPGSQSRAEVDLHVHFPGLDADPDEVWRVLECDARTLQVAHRLTPVPSEAATLLILVLHAARSANDVGKPLADLRRALQVVPPSVWHEARLLADELQAVPALSSGLSLDSDGQLMAQRLGLPSPTSTEWILRSRGGSGKARFLLAWWQAPWQRKGPMLAREVWPTTSFLRLRWLRPDEYGRIAVLRAHVRRWRELLAALPTALIGLASALRTARRGRRIDREQALRDR